MYAVRAVWEDENYRILRRLRILVSFKDMGFLIVSLLVAAALYIAYTLWALYSNYRLAQSTGLPIVLCPYDPDGVIWALICVPLRPFLRFILPSPIFANVELTIWGWEFRDKAAIHDKLGLSFMVVNTGLNRLITADPAMGNIVLSKRRAFIHAEAATMVMGMLGPNVITAKEDGWSRQRRVIAPALNERISAAVWDESVEQADTLADLLTTPPLEEFSAQTIPCLRKIAINVLSRIAYGHRNPLTTAPVSYKPSVDINYVDAISLCTELLVWAAFMPIGLLKLPVMPDYMQKLGVALTKLPELTKNMLEQERHKNSASAPEVLADTKPTTSSIMSTLVRMSDEDKERKEQIQSGNSQDSMMPSSGKTFLTEDEIAGNLFIFTAAGFDTTANTMAYAATILAVYPEWQLWIQNEIDNVFGGRHSKQIPLGEYAAAFPMLQRCMAVMFETLRLYPPVTLLLRCITTEQEMSPSHSSLDTFMVPSPCAVHLNITALHTSESTWGTDALEFRPARWLRPESEEADTTDPFVKPPKGTFIPWSSGPRVCPGQKMAQVEFVSVMATLFHKCSVEPVLKPGESMEQARTRLLGLLEDSQPVLTLQMNRPQEVQLKWSKRN